MQFQGFFGQDKKMQLKNKKKTKVRDGCFEEVFYKQFPFASCKYNWFFNSKYNQDMRDLLIIMMLKKIYIVRNIIHKLTM